MAGIIRSTLNEFLNTCQFCVMSFELHDLVNQNRNTYPRALKNSVNFHRVNNYLDHVKCAMFGAEERVQEHMSP